MQNEARAIGRSQIIQKELTDHSMDFGLLKAVSLGVLGRGWEASKTWILKRVRKKKGYIILRQLLQESRETITYMYVYMCWGRGKV